MFEWVCVCVCVCVHMCVCVCVYVWTVANLARIVSLVARLNARALPAQCPLLRLWESAMELGGQRQLNLLRRAGTLLDAAIDW